MLALGLTGSLFVFWLLAGYAVLALLRARRHAVQNLLLAPVVGISVTLLPIFWLSRAGLPVVRFAAVLTISLFLASIGLLWRLRPVFPLRQYWPFGAALLLAMFLTGRPLAEFGFDWLSYSNDDMANYVLAAVRILNHGFFDIPSAEALVSGTDYSLTYWFLNLGARSGSEMLISWVAGITGLMPDRIYMPLMLALHLVLISTGGALVNRSHSFRLPALVTCVMLSCSALTSLGTLYQLISQVAGVALLAGACSLLLDCRLLGELRTLAGIPEALLISFVVSALLVVYPEVLPFLVLSLGLFLLIGLVRRQFLLQSLFNSLGPAVLLTLVFLNGYTITALGFLRVQAAGALRQATVEATPVPYYLTPAGFSSFWGFGPIARMPPEPWLSTGILMGAILLIAALGAGFRESWMLRPSAIVSLGMLGLSPLLFAQRSGFGLFKLAMYIQPFVLGTMPLAWFGLIKRPMWRILPFLLLALLGLGAQSYYVESSRGGLSGRVSQLTEVPWASAGRINDESRDLVATAQSRQVVSDTSNIILAKFQALYLEGIELAFPVRDVFSNIAGADPGFQLFHPGISAVARTLQEARNTRFVGAEFELNEPARPTSVNEFVIDDLQPPTTNSQETELLSTTARQSIVNRWKSNTEANRDFYVEGWNLVQNHLVFISSQLGQSYQLGDRSHVALYQLEPDLYFTGDTMAGIGRYFLFQVINPTEGARLVVSLTATLKGDGEVQLPPAVAIGSGRWSFPVIGRGSARVFSPPLTPQFILGRPYLGIDMGIDATRFPEHRVGLMTLYGEDVPADSRMLVGFGRDISLVSAADYASMMPPSQLANFPADLADPDLEYSGLYEDGWISEAAFFRLSQPESTSQLLIRGQVPGISDPSFSTEVRVWLDAQEIARELLLPGDFELRLQAPTGALQRRIDLRFSATQRLPSPDDRPVAALLRFVGFEP